MVEVLHSVATILGKLGANLALGRLVGPKLRSLQAAYRPLFPAAFFAGGFAFDVATLGRIDHRGTLLQQGVFLLLIGCLLSFEARSYVSGVPLPDPFEKRKGYLESLMHFLFGGLLSAYTIFYFKSSSLIGSAIFMLLLTTLLILNERPVLRRSGLPVKFLLFGLCVASFFTYLVPIVWGSIGLVPFTVSICLSLLLTSLFLLAITRKVQVSLRKVRHLVAPTLSIQILFSGLYAMGVLPPVPLSIQYMGVFHGVERSGNVFLLYHENPYWRFWHDGDQVFNAREGDRIYGFARIFSPTNFSDAIFIRWLHETPAGEWSTSDRIRIDITGGREQGFRGYTYKQNYQAGDWQMRVETGDGRELGRMYFVVKEDRRPGSRSFRSIEG